MLLLTHKKWGTEIDMTRMIHSYPELMTNLCESPRHWRFTHLSTRVLMTASVSSTKPSTFCFFRRGSCGPRPRRGGRTGSLGRLPLASGGSDTELSTRLSCLRGADPSSTSLSSLHTQLFPMAPPDERLGQNCTDCSCSTVSRRTRTRLLLAQNAIQVATIISLEGL